MWGKFLQGWPWMLTRGLFPVANLLVESVLTLFTKNDHNHSVLVETKLAKVGCFYWDTIYKQLWQSSAFSNCFCFRCFSVLFTPTIWLFKTSLTTVQCYSTVEIDLTRYDWTNEKHLPAAELLDSNHHYIPTITQNMKRRTVIHTVISFMPVNPQQQPCLLVNGK